MLIELTDSLMSFSKEESAQVKQSIFNLLCGFFEGNFYLTASPSFCLFFMKLLPDSRCQSSLHYMDINWSVAPKVLFQLSVVLHDPDPSKGEVDYLFFSKTDSVQAPFFLCESFNDIRFYKKLVGYYNPYAQIRSFDLAGGGDSTSDMFLSLRNRNCISLTIVDSDRKYPGCSLGSTAKKCSDRYRSDKPNMRLVILNCHEVENLIPISFLINHACIEGRKFIKKVRSARKESELRYYDYKLGLNKSVVSNSTEFLEYFRRLYSFIYRDNVDNYLSSIADEGTLLPRIGKNCLSSFLNNPPKYISSDYLDNDRKAIADTVFSVMCCRGDDPLF